MRAAIPRKYWIGRMTRDPGESLPSDIGEFCPQARAIEAAGRPLHGNGRAKLRRPKNLASPNSPRTVKIRAGLVGPSPGARMKLNSTAWILTPLMCGAAIAGVAGRPNTTAVSRGDAIRLETAVPKTFGEWSEFA